MLIGGGGILVYSCSALLLISFEMNLKTTDFIRQNMNMYMNIHPQLMLCSFALNAGSCF